jgi:hypothetical protein
LDASASTPKLHSFPRGSATNGPIKSSILPRSSRATAFHRYRSLRASSHQSVAGTHSNRTNRKRFHLQINTAVHRAQLRSLSLEVFSATPDHDHGARERRIALARFAAYPYPGNSVLQVAERRPRSGLLTPGSRRLAAFRQPPRHRSSIEIGRLAAHGGSVEPSRLNPWVVRDANGHALAYVYFEGMSLAGAQVLLLPRRRRAYCRVGFDGRGLVNKTPLGPLISHFGRAAWA